MLICKTFIIYYTCSIFILGMKYTMIVFTDKININQTGGTLSAYSIWGIIRGLETFSQLVSLEETDDGPTVNII